MPNKNKPDPYFKVGTIDRLRKLGRGTSRIYSCDGVDVAVFQMKPGYLAVADACPHMGASMGRGRLRNGTLECDWHNWVFDVKTGECREKAGCRLDTYDVKVEGDDLYLRLHVDPESAGQGQSLNSEDNEDWGKFDPNLHFKKPAGDE